MVEELIGGAEGARTPDPKTASLVLSQLSYSPTRALTLQGACGKCQGKWCRGSVSVRLSETAIALLAATVTVTLLRSMCGVAIVVTGAGVSLRCGAGGGSRTHTP